MQYESDTESDSETHRSETDIKSPTACQPTSRRSSSSHSLSEDAPSLLVVEQAKREIQKLCDLDVTSPLENALLSLQTSADILMKFASGVPDLMALDDDLGEVLVVFSTLIKSAFFDRLFQYRALFRQLAIRSNRVPFASTVVTWVDELIAKLSSLLPQMASGFIPVEHDTNRLSQSIQIQKRDDALRAAIQLPERWQDVHLVIGTADFSPAAKRIATSLLFGAYIMEPQLAGAEVWPEPSPSRSVLLGSLHFAARSVFSVVQNCVNAFEFSSQKFSVAMLVVLFAAVDHKMKTHGSSASESPSLLPERFGCLLDLIILLMNQDSDFFYPLEELDAPQTILLRWGNAVPWSWSTWDDQRIANSEYLRLLTATWLCHMNEALFPGRTYTANDEFRTDLHFWLVRDISSSSLMILQLFHDVVNYMNHAQKSGIRPTRKFYEMIGKISWALIQYLESHIVQANLEIEARIIDFTRCILVIYSHFASSNDHNFVKDLIIEILTLISSESFTESLRSVLLDNISQFLPKLDEATRVCANRLINRENSDEYMEYVDVAKSLLYFFTIILFQDKLKNNAVQEIITPFITSMVKISKSKASDCQVLQILRNPVLSSLCALKTLPGKGLKHYSEEDICLLAIHTGAYGMITTGTFAQYLLMSSATALDPLLCYQTWDHFLSAMATIVDQQTTSEEEPTALLAITAICYALQKLVTCSDVPTIRLFLSSPWTFTMEKILRDFMANKEIAQIPYLVCLKKRLGGIGESLLKEISKRANSAYDLSNLTPSKLDISNPKLSHRLLYYRDDNYSGLLLVCDIDA